MMTGETITIAKSEYERLRKAELKLIALEAHGVDNWPYYDDAMEDYEAKLEERS